MTIKSKKNSTAASNINFYRDKKNYFYNPDLASSGLMSSQAIHTNSKVSNSNLKDYDIDSTSMTNNAYTNAQNPIYLHKKGVKLFQLAKEEGTF